jgi:hypothetical protein
MAKIEVKYKAIKTPIVKIEATDEECERTLVAQRSKSVSKAVTLYVSGARDSRVRLPWNDAIDFAHHVITLAREVGGDKNG